MPDQTEQQKTQEWADKSGPVGESELTPELAHAIEKKYKELEDLLFVKDMIAKEGADPLATRRDMPTYDPEDRSRVQRESQTDELRKTRDTMKKLLDDYYAAQMLKAMSWPSSSPLL